MQFNVIIGEYPATEAIKSMEDASLLCKDGNLHIKVARFRMGERIIGIENILSFFMTVGMLHAKWMLKEDDEDVEWGKAVEYFKSTEFFQSILDTLRYLDFGGLSYPNENLDIIINKMYPQKEHDDMFGYIEGLLPGDIARLHHKLSTGLRFTNILFDPASFIELAKPVDFKEVYGKFINKAKRANPSGIKQLSLLDD